MDNLNTLIEKEIFQNTKEKHIPEKMECLFRAFLNNKEVLTTAFDYYQTHIEKGNKYPSIKKDIHQLLKKYWLSAWLNKGIDKKDLMIIPIYFDSYTAKQQMAINQKLESLDATPFSKTKEISPLTLALSSYKKGSPDELSNWVEQQQEVKNEELNRIYNIVFNNFINGTLPIVTKSLSKFKKGSSITFLSGLHYQKLLTQPSKDVIEFIKMIKTKSYLGNTKSEIKSKNEDILYKCLELNVYNKSDFSNSLIELLYNIKDKPAEDIRQSLLNIEKILTICEPTYSSFMANKFKIDSKGLDSLFDCLASLETKFEDILKHSYFDEDYKNFLDFTHDIQPVIITYQHMKMNETLKNTSVSKHKAKKI